ncbi:MAG: stage II sporulation protein P [Clostridiales bacterium]|nr:stage II sporulation protein P [Clostridiales bacterium]
MKVTNERKRLLRKFYTSAGLLIIGVIIAFGHGSAMGEVFLYQNIPGSKMGFSGREADVFNEDYEEIDVAGEDEISFMDESPASKPEEININALKNIAELRKKFYIVDKKTLMTEDYFNVDKFLNTDLKIKKNGDFPKVLIFHTHSHEMFKDSAPNNIYEGVVGAGKRLKEKLEEKGIKCIHCTDRFDMVDGKVKIIGAYERMEPAIRKILSDNPSIEVVIDLHRDGIDESKKLVTTINGKPTARLMFFNGICRILEDGKFSEIKDLQNPYVKDNLAFSFNLNLKAKQKFSGLSRGIYLNAYRYSLHMAPKSTLVEIGAQNNTKEEIFNAVDLLSEVISEVID